MKTSAIRKLRRQLAADRPAVGMWITLEAPSITEMAVGLGVDWVLIDAEHGHLDWNDVCAHIRATVRSDTVALVRLAELNIALVKRAIDLGADGIVIPWIETPEQLRQAVSFARFPPRACAASAANEPPLGGNVSSNTLTKPTITCWSCR